MPVVEESTMQRTSYRDILPVPQFIEFAIPEYLRPWASKETKYTYSTLKHLTGRHRVPPGNLSIAAWTATVQIYLLFYSQDEEGRPFSDYCRVTYTGALRYWRAAQYLDALKELYNNNILHVVTFLNTCVNTERFRSQFSPHAPYAHLQPPRIWRCLYTIAASADAESAREIRGIRPLLLERNEAAQQESPAELNEE